MFLERTLDLKKIRMVRTHCMRGRGHTGPNGAEREETSNGG
jgi:hypothetical protein